MELQRPRRKLTAILSADVDGYSRLMGDDEVRTVRTLTAHRQLMATLIRELRGRVVDSPGDNLLAEFTSVAEAVECAVQIQKELSERNTKLPADRRMEFRIGINLGDVIAEGDRIYGDAVNVAARIQELAEKGSIFISGTVYNQIENKMPFSYEFLGEHAIKNIAQLIPVYRVLTEPGAVVGIRKRAFRRSGRSVTLAVALLFLLAGVGSVGTLNSYLRHSAEIEALALADKPSIVVLPFVNLSDDPKKEHFSDGLTDEIITSLSKVSGIFVIARTSAFTYKGKAAKAQEVSRDLGVKYILEGSVRKAADTVRITAQLIDATTGHHLWAERYDSAPKDVFAVQDEITHKIVTAMQVKLAEGEQLLLWRRTTNNVEAWEYFMQAQERYQQGTKEGFAEARQLLGRAIELDPKFAMAYVRLARAHTIEVRFGMSPFPARSLEQALELTRKAIALDETLADAYGQLGLYYLVNREHEQAIAYGRKAVELSPSGAEVRALLANTLNFSGRPEEGLAMIRQAMRLSPVYPAWYLNVLGKSYLETGRYNEALAAYKEARDRIPENILSHAGVVNVYSRIGQEKDARAAAAELLKVDPTLSLERFAKIYPYGNLSDLEESLRALRKVGLN